LGIPFFVTNHVYDTQGLFSHKVQSGGAGIQYANSLSVFLSKSKDKVGTEVVGAILHCKLEKGRLTKENTVIDVSLDYGSGLDRYYGLLELGLKYELFKKVKEDKKEKILIGLNKATEKQIEAHPEEYFTEDVLKALDVCAGKEFNYGTNIIIPEEIEEVENE